MKKGRNIKIKKVFESFRNENRGAACGTKHCQHADHHHLFLNESGKDCGFILFLRTKALETTGAVILFFNA
jgi:hypothetical protein